MEPPTKRLRIMQSVQVDESNPDYIREKQLAKQQLKNKWEALFAKYEGMHESMTDEIDMRSGKVVVDRGHCRRLERQLATMRPRLLDDVMGDDGKDENGDTDDDSNIEDELAPTQHRKKNFLGPHSRSSARLQDGTPRKSGLESSPFDNATTQERLNITGDTIPQPAQHTIDTSSMPPDLLQFMQFPQTPQGQRDQNAFLTSLTQTINQAVQQAVTPIISNIIARTPITQGSLNIRSPLSDSVPTTTQKPSSDPKWYFPPLPDAPPKPLRARSSLDISQSSPVGRNAVLEDDINPVVHSEGDMENLLSMGGADDELRSDSFILHRESSEEQPNGAEIRLRSNKKYYFTLEEDIYFSKQRMKGHTFKDIRDSMPQWRDWPIHAILSHWHRHLRHKNLHLRDLPETRSSVSQASILRNRERQSNSVIKAEASREFIRPHFPTPISLEQSDQLKPVDEADDATSNSIHKVIAAGGHFDDEDLELLSLQGDDSQLEQETTECHENQTLDDLDEHILPSIELKTCLSEYNPSLRAQQSGSKFCDYQAVPDSEDGMTPQDIDVDSIPVPNVDVEQLDLTVVCSDSDLESDIERRSYTVRCDLCSKTFTGKLSERYLKRHMKHRCPMRMTDTQVGGASKPLSQASAQRKNATETTPQVRIPRPARDSKPAVVAPTIVALGVEATSAGAPTVVSPTEIAVEKLRTTCSPTNAAVKEEAVEDTPFLSSPPRNENTEEDELQLPLSPIAKNDFSSPLPPKSSFRSNAFRTPKSVGRFAPLPSSGAGSMSSAGRKSFLQQVKQSWTKKRGTSSSPVLNSAKKRKSHPIAPSKRKWVDDHLVSDDELAM